MSDVDRFWSKVDTSGGWHKRAGKWRATRRGQHLGLFPTRDEAEDALA